MCPRASVPALPMECNTIRMRQNCLSVRLYIRRCETRSNCIFFDAIACTYMYEARQSVKIWVLENLGY
jgi:hypothetical protein